MYFINKNPKKFYQCCSQWVGKHQLVSHIILSKMYSSSLCCLH